MKKTKEQLSSIMKIGNQEVEHTGGYNWSILHGDSMRLIREFQPGAFDAIITDPPYASGGFSAAEKGRSTAKKYSSMTGDKALPDFEGDQKDQRSWMHWMTDLLVEAKRVSKPGAVLVVFIDWRMAPCLSDAIQQAGWRWRGEIVWDKPNSRPQRGRFRQQSEYALWASNGDLPLDRGVGCLPGVFTYPNPQRRTHLTEKPLGLMREIVRICVPGGRILDPFAGAATTILAAVQEGYEAVGIEVTDAYYERGSERVRRELEAADTRQAKEYQEQAESEC